MRLCVYIAGRSAPFFFFFFCFFFFFFPLPPPSLLLLLLLLPLLRPLLFRRLAPADSRAPLSTGVAWSSSTRAYPPSGSLSYSLERPFLYLPPPSYPLFLDSLQTRSPPHRSALRDLQGLRIRSFVRVDFRTKFACSPLKRSRRSGSNPRPPARSLARSPVSRAIRARHPVPSPSPSTPTPKRIETRGKQKKERNEEKRERKKKGTREENSRLDEFKPGIDTVRHQLCITNSVAPRFSCFDFRIPAIPYSSNIHRFEIHLYIARLSSIFSSLLVPQSFGEKWKRKRETSSNHPEFIGEFVRLAIETRCRKERGKE